MATVAAAVAEELARELNRVPHERQNRLVLGSSVAHWEHVGTRSN
jgi:hypothetical protein